MADNLQVFADDATACIASLEKSVYLTTQRFEEQQQINTNIGNRLNPIEVSDEGNPNTPVANSEPQPLSSYDPLASVAQHIPPAFHGQLGQAGYITPVNQSPLGSGAPCAPPP